MKPGKKSLVVLFCLFTATACLAGLAPSTGFHPTLQPPEKTMPLLEEPTAVPKKQLQLAATVYHGNIKSHKFHRPGCRYYNCKACTRIFTSKAQALEAGYIPCKVCRP